MSDIESRRFAAVLDAMDERLDPEKIERTRIAKYLIENEPVSMRDILPAVMAELFEKTSPARLDVISIVKYYESRLAAHQARPAAHQARLAAHQARLAAHQARPAAHQARPAAHQARPAAHQARSAAPESRANHQTALRFLA